MKRILQLLAVLLAIGALIQTVALAKDGNGGRGRQGEGSPGI